MASMVEPLTQTPDTRASTGIDGLDEILGGGFTPHRMYSVQSALLVVHEKAEVALEIEWTVEQSWRDQFQ
jgi:hypothetical protein